VNHRVEGIEPATLVEEAIVRLLDGGGGPLAAYAEISFHSDLRRIGERAIVALLDVASASTGLTAPVIIGRHEPRFSIRDRSPRALEDPCVSRVQLELTFDEPTGMFRVRPQPDARRRVTATDAHGRACGLEAIAPGSFIAIGDRVQLLLDIAPLRSLAADVSTSITQDPVRDADPLAALIGDDPQVVALREQTRRAAESDGALLIVGEAGAGKKLLARGVHAASKRAQGAFVSVKCSVLPKSSAEAELFGHVLDAREPGRRATVGLFRAAHGGTLLLEEIEELAPRVQRAVHRTIVDGIVRAVGDGEEHRIDVRVICVSRRDPRAEAASGRFDAELGAHLALLCLVVPALRTRKRDIPRLFSRFLLAHAPPALVREATKSPPPLPLAHWITLFSHDWPRNVRELERHAATVAHAAKEAGGFRVPLEWPPRGRPREEIRVGASKTPDAAPRPGMGGGSARPPLEELLAALDEHNYVQARVAKRLGVSRTTLDKWMRELGIHRPSDLTDEQIVAASAECDGDVPRMAVLLKVSERGLRLRIC
jgi:DNA-binding NtrC family response regulator